MNSIQHNTSDDSWKILRSFTEARIALGRTGVSQSTEKILSFSLAHAMARDSIYQPFEKNILEQELNELHREMILLKSKVSEKKEFLLRPDLGRQLSEESIEKINACQTSPFDICINISDGLSAKAVNTHAIPLLKILIKKFDELHYQVAPICIIENGRVAISDETGSLLGAKISVMLIGERPGLTASDSMGAYLTYDPHVGNTDAQRNCVSNIRNGGLHYEEAAEEIIYLIKRALHLKLSGTGLKSNLNLPENQ
jgi:ethanolamine ammonia-lyase small subunit